MHTIKKILLLIAVVCGLSTVVFSQTIGNMSQSDYRVIQQMNIGTYSNAMKRTNRAAYLEIGDSTNSTKALLLPRGDTAAVTFPIKGLLFYQLSNTTIYQYNGTAWTGLGGISTLTSIGGALDIQTGGAGDIRTLLATDFDVTANVIGIDYTNGQASSGSLKGFLTSADWTTFNNKIAGTIADDQVAVGSLANTIEGTSNLTFNTFTNFSATAEGLPDGALWTTATRNSLPYNTAALSAGYLAEVKYNSSGDYARIGGIGWYKNNTVDGDNGSYVAIYNRINGSLSLGAAALGITTTQDILMGTNDIGEIKLQVQTNSATQMGQLIRLTAGATNDAWQVQASTFDVLGSLSPTGVLYSKRGQMGLYGTPAADALLDLNSSTLGFLPPRMSPAERLAIPTPSYGLFVYDWDSARYMGHNGSVWKGIRWTDEAGGGGATPTLQQVLDAGSTLGSNETISVGSNLLTISGTGTVFRSESTGGLPLDIYRTTSFTSNAQIDAMAINLSSTGTAGNDLVSAVVFNIEAAGGTLLNTGKLGMRWADATVVSRTSWYDFYGVDNTNSERFMNVQPTLIRFNDDADTVASRAYARTQGNIIENLEQTLAAGTTLLNPYTISSGSNAFGITTGGTFTAQQTGSGHAVMFQTYSGTWGHFGSMYGSHQFADVEVFGSSGSGENYVLIEARQAVSQKHNIRIKDTAMFFDGLVSGASNLHLYFGTLPSSGTTTLLGINSDGRLVTTTGGGGGFTNLTQFVSQTAHRIFYSDASGDIQELAYGTSGQYLKSNGTTSTLSWDTPSGSGTVNSGNQYSVAYYDATGTAVNDWPGLKVGQTGINTEIIQQSTTDIGLKIQLAGSSAEDALSVFNSGATKVASIDENGYGVFERVGLGGTNPTSAYLQLSTSNSATMISTTGGTTSRWYHVSGYQTFFHINANGKEMVMGIDHNIANGGDFFFGWNHSPFGFGLSFDETTGYTHIGGFDGVRRLHVTESITYLERSTHSSSATVTTGFGWGKEIELENASNTKRIAATFEVPYTDATDATEDADIVFKTIRAGTLTTAGKFISTGGLYVDVLAQDDAETKVVVWNSTDKVFEWRDVTTISGGSGGHTIEEEGTPLTARTGLNFVGAGITAADDSGNDETDVTLDADLNTIAGLTATTDNFLVSVSSAWASRTPSQVRTTLALVIGTDVQAWDTDLDTWATLNSSNFATLTGTQTLSGKTLTAPKIANAGFIADANGNELIIFTTTASAVNEITFANGATGNNATITASGETNAGITITGKGTKGVSIGNALLEKSSTVSDGAGAVIDASLGNYFAWTAAADRTAGTTTNPTTGQKIIIAFTASGANRTLTLPTATTGDFIFGTDITGLTVTTSGKTDLIGCIYNGTRWMVVAYTKGF